MKPTRILLLLWNTIGAALMAALAVFLLIGAGLAVPTSGLNLLLTLPAIALIDIALVWPIMRYKKALADYLLGVSKKRPKRPEPFYAVRVLMISKSSALAGAWFLGWHLGVIFVQLSTAGFNESVAREALGAFGSLLLAIAGVIAERGCRLPDDGDDKVGETEAQPIAPKPAGAPTPTGKLSK